MRGLVCLGKVHCVAIIPERPDHVANALRLRETSDEDSITGGDHCDIVEPAQRHMGMIGQIVCGTGGCQTVQNSPWASFFGVPVPLIGLLGYGAMFATALLGTRVAMQDDHRVAIVLVVGAVIGVGFSLYLTYLEMFVINAWCRWCIASAIVAALLFAAVIPEFARMRRSRP